MSDCVMPSRAEEIAQAFHEAYERLAPDHGYETREASAVPWENVPEQNKGLMVAVVQSLLDSGTLGSPVVNVHVQSTGPAGICESELARKVQQAIAQFPLPPGRTA